MECIGNVTPTALRRTTTQIIHPTEDSVHAACHAKRLVAILRHRGGYPCTSTISRRNLSSDRDCGCSKNELLSMLGFVSCTQRLSNVTVLLRAKRKQGPFCKILDSHSSPKNCHISSIAIPTGRQQTQSMRQSRLSPNILCLWLKKKRSHFITRTTKSVDGDVRVA